MLSCLFTLCLQNFQLPTSVCLGIFLLLLQNVRTQLPTDSHTCQFSTFRGHEARLNQRRHAGRTLHEAKYHLRTKLGISEGFISHCTAHPIYGTGQGSGNSPVSSTLFDCHVLKAHGALFTSPDQSLSVTLYMMGFVDATSNRTNFFQAKVQPTMEELLRMMQHDAQLWNDLLWASGGALELPKCSYHHIRFDFDTVGRPHMKEGQFGPNLVIRDAASNEVVIQQLSASQSHKNLGCHKSPIGNQSKQKRNLTETCLDLAKSLRCHPLSQSDSLVYCRSFYFPSVTYPLSPTFFEEKELNSIQNTANRSLTQSCGFASNTKWEILYGPPDYGGRTFGNLIDSQGHQQIQLFIKHWRTPSDINLLLHIMGPALPNQSWKTPPPNSPTLTANPS